MFVCVIDKYEEEEEEEEDVDSLRSMINRTKVAIRRVELWKLVRGVPVVGSSLPVLVLV